MSSFFGSPPQLNHSRLSSSFIAKLLALIIASHFPSDRLQPYLNQLSMAHDPASGFCCDEALSKAVSPSHI